MWRTVGSTSAVSSSALIRGVFFPIPFKFVSAKPLATP